MAWHGLVEVPGALVQHRAGLGSASAAWENKELYLDDLNQYAPQEARRAGSDSPAGLPPPDRLIQSIPKIKPKGMLVDISGVQDGSLYKEVVGTVPPHSASVQQGSKVVVTITAVDANKDVLPAKRILHGPAEHQWVAGSGVRCELVELAVASMQIDEVCVVVCSNPMLYEDVGLGIHACPSLSVEYSLHLRSMHPVAEFILEDSAVVDLKSAGSSLEHLLRRVEMQTKTAAARLMEGKVQIALVQYGLILKDLENYHSDVGTRVCGDSQGIMHLHRDIELQRVECFLSCQQWFAATRICSALLSADSGHVQALLKRGHASQRLGNSTQACEDFASVLARDPDNVVAKLRLEQCQKRLDSLATAKTDKAQFRTEQAARRSRGKWE